MSPMAPPPPPRPTADGTAPIPSPRTRNSSRGVSPSAILRMLAFGGGVVGWALLILIAVDHRIVRVIALVLADGFRAAWELGGLNRWVYFEVARIALGGAAVSAPTVAFACAGSLRRSALAGAFLFSAPMVVAFLAVIMHVETTTAWLFVLTMSAALTLA